MGEKPYAQLVQERPAHVAGAHPGFFGQRPLESCFRFVQVTAIEMCRVGVVASEFRGQADKVDGVLMCLEEPRVHVPPGADSK